MCTPANAILHKIKVQKMQICARPPMRACGVGFDVHSLFFAMIRIHAHITVQCISCGRRKEFYAV